MKHTLLVYLFFLLTTSLTAATFQWNGTGNWNDNTKWSDSGGTPCTCTPTATDDVHVVSGTLTIPNGMSVQITKIEVTANLVIANTATVTISGNNYGIDTNTGSTVMNAGTIDISNVSGTIPEGTGINNWGSFTNQNGGIIHIGNVNTYGIFNTQQGTFDNEMGAVINISNTGSSGIVEFLPQGAMTNSGTINISDIAGRGIRCLGTITNEASGEIYLSNIDDFAISSESYDNANFQNDGIIELTGTNGNNGLHLIKGDFSNANSLTLNNCNIGIYNSGECTFTNATNGVVNIDGTTTYGIFNTDEGEINNATNATINMSNIGSTGIFTALNFSGTIIVAFVYNNGTINIMNNIGEYGVDVNGSFINQAGANLNISNTSNSGIRVVEGQFTNEENGTVTIASTIDDGVYVPFSGVGANNFRNRGDLNITQSIGQYGINCSGNCINEATGEIVIANTTQAGIREEGSSRDFENSGNLQFMDNIGTHAIELDQGDFVNETGGQIDIEDATNHGIFFSSASDVFENQTGAIVTLQNIVGNGVDGFTGSGSVTNDGNFIFHNTITGNGIAGPFVNNGMIEGESTHLGSFLTNNGTIAPGFSPGITTLDGDYDHTNANATFNMEIFGTDAPGTANGHDQIAITGEADLGGILNVTLGGSYVPTAGDEFTLVDFQGGVDATNDDFVTVNLPDANWSYLTSGSNLRVGFMTVLLPVELIDFQVISNNKHVYLNWSTASEINNKGFEIERSADGKNWQKIGFITGNGTTNIRQNYQFSDTSPLSNSNYYRLKQIDFDGRFDYSKIELITFEKQNTPITIFPNPFKKSIEIKGIHLENNTVEIFNLNGQKIMEIQPSSSILNLENLPIGTYFIHINDGKQIFSKRLVKQ